MGNGIARGELLDELSVFVVGVGEEIVVHIPETDEVLDLVGGIMCGELVFGGEEVAAAYFEDGEARHWFSLGVEEFRSLGEVEMVEVGLLV